MNTLPKLSTDYVWSHAHPVSYADPGLKTPSEWQNDRDQHGRVDFYDIESLRFIRVRGNPVCIEKKEESIKGDKAETIKVLLQLSGRAIVEQGGKSALITPGDWTLYDDSRPYSISILERAEQRLMALPLNELSRYKFDFEKLTAQQFSTTEGNGKYLEIVLRTALDNVSEFGELVATDLGGVAIHSLRLALIEKSGHSIQLHRSELMRERVKIYINRHLNDPLLSVDTLALAMNCSKSYLHKAFSENEETISQYVLNQRLEKCFAELSNTPMATASIAQVAFSWGFNSLSHFSTVFSKRYGMAPSQCRQVRASANNDDKKTAGLLMPFKNEPMRKASSSVHI